MFTLVGFVYVYNLSNLYTNCRCLLSRVQPHFTSCVGPKHYTVSKYRRCPPCFWGSADTLHHLWIKKVHFINICTCLYKLYLYLLWNSVQISQMVEVNLDTAKYRSKHLQHHPAHEPSQGRIVCEEMSRKMKKKWDHGWKYDKAERKPSPMIWLLRKSETQQTKQEECEVWQHVNERDGCEAKLR